MDDERAWGGDLVDTARRVQEEEEDRSREVGLACFLGIVVGLLLGFVLALVVGTR